MIFQCRQQGGKRGPVDTGHRAQRELGDRHQRAGITGADGGSGVTRLHRLDSAPHRGALGPAQCLAGLVLTADDAFGMQDFGAGPEVGMSLECGFDPRLVPYQQELELIMATARECGALDHDAHTFVAAHRIDSDTRQTHAFSPKLVLGLRLRPRRFRDRCSDRKRCTGCAGA